ASTATYTLSLHDALPIFVNVESYKQALMTNEQKAIKTIYFSILGNTVLAIVKWLAGLFGNSFALIADAIESTSDIFSSILVLLRSEEHTSELQSRENLVC